MKMNTQQNIDISDFCIYYYHKSNVRSHSFHIYWSYLPIWAYNHRHASFLSPHRHGDQFLVLSHTAFAAHRSHSVIFVAIGLTIPPKSFHILRHNENDQYESEVAVPEPPGDGVGVGDKYAERDIDESQKHGEAAAEMVDELPYHSGCTLLDTGFGTGWKTGRSLRRDM